MMFLLLCLHGLARGQTDGYSCYYWFDDDYASLRTITSPTDRWQIIADASGLGESLHTIHLLVRDGEGRQSNPMTQLFMHTTELSEQSTAYYWFDSQQGKPQTSPMLQGSFDVDASTLADGIHTFHYLVAKSDGSISMPTVSYFLKATSTASLGQPTCLCLVDGKLVHKEQLPANGGAIHWNLDVGGIADGLHVLQIEALSATGALSGSRHSYFVKMPKTDGITKGYYWFDEETDVHEVAVTNDTFEVDASSLSDGFHRFHYQALHSNGTTSMPTASFFLKTAQVNVGDELNCICTVDGQLRHIEKMSNQGGVIHWDLDMHDLTDGLHRIQLQTVTMSGAMSGSYTSYFMRVTTPEELGEMRCLYAIDNDAFDTDASVVGNNGNYHFDLDLSALSDGLHNISYMLYNDRGTSTKIQTRFFLKVPLGGNAVGQYQYWLNDDDISEAKTVTLPQKVNPLQLMSLLSVESRPLRSSQFHFDVSSGQPKVYAKNTIHLRFYDAAMRFSDAVKDYADYSVGQDVNVIKELESGIRETTEWPEENEIKWYQVTAERGDSLSFKTDIATTLQLFSPSGKEVYSASGSEVVKWGGCHAPETGTFYLALHDVTATQGDNISIDYEHIDRYAVLRQDVTVVGNGGCSTITFEGNGFRDLYAVDLYNEQGDTIKHILIGHESNATTSVAFDFTGASLGEYHAKFHFTEEDKVFLNLVTVEEAVDIELVTTVSYLSVFLRGTSTTYTIKITNKGNMTAYNVPIYTFIQNKNENSIHNIKYDGLGLVTYAETVSIDGMSEKDRDIIQSISNEICDDWQFFRFKGVDENTGDSICVRSNYFITNIPPNTTKTLTLTLTSSEDVHVYVTIPPQWQELSYQSLYSRREYVKKASLFGEGFNYCCYREGIECLADILVSRLDAAAIATTIISLLGLQVEIAALVDAVDCAAGLGNTALKHYGYNQCGLNDDITFDEWYSQAINVERSLIGSVVSCIGGKIGNIIGPAISNYGDYGETMKSILQDFIIPGVPIGSLLSSVKCVKKFFKPQPGCPPNPPQGGKSSSVASLDPNDIYGYDAESGSHAVKDGQTDVYYRIEFENDPAFATAAAHEIMVTDTLDTTKFDLSTFAPTRVKIGEKSAELTGDKNFVTTIDMRPEINAIAQVKGTFDQQKGIAKWHISSLDPMTMEPTDDVMQGVLPVNHGGNGMGEVMFDISLKPGLAHGTEVNNRAGIIFDQNDVIMTPTWTNTIDRVKPVSHITKVEQVNGGETAAVSIEATDDGSGPWRYNVYVQYGSGAWFLAAENVPIDTEATVKLYEDMEHHFYCVATDMADNVEQKEPGREFSLAVGKVTVSGDVNGDGKVDVSDYIGVANHILGQTQAGFNEKAADVNGDGKVDVSDYIGIANIILTGSVYGK